MKLYYLVSIVMLLMFSGHAQIPSEVEVNSLIKGTLFSPKTVSGKKNLVILIAGSGPTNRSGNQIGAINNSLKFLAQDLSAKGNHVFSYDKRVVAQMIAGNIEEKSTLFDHYIGDAKDVVAYFKAQQFDNIIIAGHSEGSLIGMVAAQENVDAYISLAGPGRTIDHILIDQVSVKFPSLANEIKTGLEKVKNGDSFQTKSPILLTMLREEVQPYLRSWMNLDPQQEIKKLTIPVLIINGTRDSQIKVSEAELLKSAKPDAKMHIISNMNHVFKEVLGDDAVDLATYTNPTLPVMPELVDTMDDFIKLL